MGRCISLPKSTTVIESKRSKRKHIILSQVHPAWKDMLISKVIKLGKEMDLDGEVQNCLREASSLKRRSARNHLVKRRRNGTDNGLRKHGYRYDTGSELFQKPDGTDIERCWTWFLMIRRHYFHAPGEYDALLTLPQGRLIQELSILLLISSFSGV